MKPFLIQVIQQIQKKHSKWEEVIIVLPSKRAGVFFKHHLLEHIESAQIAPVIHSIETFVEELSSLRKASQTHQLFTLYEIYKAKLDEQNRDDFATFLQWAKRLLSDFNNLNAYRVNPNLILKELGEFYRLESVFSEKDKLSFSPAFWEALPEIYQAFENTLIEENWGTLGMLYKDALESLELYLSHTSKQHYFIGFNALNKAEQDIFQGFLVEKKGEVFWDLDQSLFENQFHAAGRFIRHYQKNWPFYRQHPLQFTDTSFLKPKKIKAIGFSGNIAQAQYVGEFLETNYKQPGSTAIILGNEQLLLAVLSQLPNELKEWNVTMGYAVEQLPFTKWFLTLVSMHAQYTEKGFDRDLLLKVFHFAPLKNLETAFHVEHEEILNTLEINFTSFVSLDELAFLLKEEFGKKLLSPVQSSTAFIDNMSFILLSFQDKIQDAMSLAVVEVLVSLLAQIRIQLEAVSFEVNLKALFALLKESIALQTFDFKGDPIEGVQLMGMLESRVLDFDRLVITHVNEGILPVGKNDQSFIPFAMKKEYGLPTFLDNDAIYTYHFYRLLQRAKEIHLLYNAKSEGLNAGEKSRFIRQLELLTHAQHAFSDEQHVAYLPKTLAAQSEVEKTPQMLERIIDLAKRGFSPTSLSTYLMNPMAFYDRYVLGIKELETVEKVLSNFARGTIVHDCVEQLYAPYLGRVLQAANYDSMLSKLPELLTKLYQKAYPKMLTPKGENHLILKAYQRGIQQFLEQEKALVVAGNELIVLALEKEFSVPLEAAVKDCEIRIRGKIDRIDQYNGTTRLIDYKTGTVKKNELYWKDDWEDFIGNHKKQPLFQLLLYAWAYLETEDVSTIDVGIISFKSPKENVLPFVRKEQSREVSQSQIDRSFSKKFHDYLVNLVQELFDLKTPFTVLEADETFV